VGATFEEVAVALGILSEAKNRNRRSAKVGYGDFLFSDTDY
jgi:hypothetical protein